MMHLQIATKDQLQLLCRSYRLASPFTNTTRLPPIYLSSKLASYSDREPLLSISSCVTASVTVFYHTNLNSNSKLTFHLTHFNELNR